MLHFASKSTYVATLLYKPSLDILYVAQLHNDHGYLCVNVNIYFCIDVMLNDTAAESTVRLVGGTSLLEGRVEIFLLGQWGTVCNDNWDLADATVVCHQLGYLRAVGAPGSTAFGAGSGLSWYSTVQCTGTEMNLTECSKYFSALGSACSYYYDDAGVVCSGE